MKVKYKINLYIIFDLSKFVSDKTPPEYIEGSPFWLSREEYVLFGCESLEHSNEGVIDDAL